MKKITYLFLLIFLLLTIDHGLWTKCGVLPNVYASVPHLVNYQGRLTDKDSKPLEGAYSLTFRIYDAETAGNLLWQETHSGAVIQKGVFSVLLGSVASLDLPFDKPYFLEIKVGNEVMSPRQRITSSGYAIRAETAEQAQNANKVANVEVSTTPQANKLLPLDTNAKLPLSALKVYDSGWFAVTENTLYTKSHNLGTTKVLVQTYFSPNSNGSPCYVQNGFQENVQTGAHQARYGQVSDLTTTQVMIRAAFWEFLASDGTTTKMYSSGYMRIIMLALE